MYGGVFKVCPRAFNVGEFTVVELTVDEVDVAEDDVTESDVVEESVDVPDILDGVIEGFVCVISCNK